ncbi:MAG TPA: AAA family ATPase [Azospirillaceae bacterium]|nr:AAA family ATPase [Azospirillaceae bacterium]
MRSFFKKRQVTTADVAVEPVALQEPAWSPRDLPPAAFGGSAFERTPDRAPERRVFDGVAPDRPAFAAERPLGRGLGGLFGGGDDRPAPPPRTSGDGEAMPRFTMPVAGGIRGTSLGEGTAAVSGVSNTMSQALREAFTPTRPKQQVNSLFVGRLATLRRIISAVEEERAHVVLYGDRGRGKTSLSNAVEQIAAQAGYMTLKVTCSAELSFEEMFRGILRRIPSTYFKASVENPFSSLRSFNNFDERLPPGPFSVGQLNDVLCEISGTHVLVTLDEFDRVASEDVKNKLAELMKTMTDTGSPLTLFVIGVAENVDQLLGKHPSIQRALVAVHLPLMSDKEIERILLAGAEAAGMRFDDSSRQAIVWLAKGLPYYAQLLGLHAARAAATRGSNIVGRDDLLAGVRRARDESERGIIEAYHRALGPEGDRTMCDVLFLAAEAPLDDWGSFRAADLPSSGGRMARVPPRETVEAVLARLTDGPDALLQRVILAGGHRLRFRNQMMRQFILISQAEDRGLI